MQLPVSRRRSEAAPSPSHPQSRIYHGPRGQPATSEGPSLSAPWARAYGRKCGAGSKQAGLDISIMLEACAGCS